MWISKREYQAIQNQVEQYRQIIQDQKQNHHLEVQGLRDQIGMLKDLVTELVKQAYQRPQIEAPPTRELPDGGRWIGDSDGGVYISKAEIDALLHGEGMKDEPDTTD